MELNTRQVVHPAFSDTAQDAGISHKMAIITGELYDRLQRRHPGDLYENEVVLWNVLWLAEFEQTLNIPVPAFTFTTASDPSGSLRIRVKVFNSRLRMAITMPET